MKISPRILLAFIWGFAEATLFFIVPDVWLTVLARKRNDREVWWAVGYSVLGALLGGILMWSFGRWNPEAAVRILNMIPSISLEMIRSVGDRINLSGWTALMTGPLQGIPYKIYAVQFGIKGWGLLPFLAVSVPARAARFLLMVIVTRAGCELMERFFKQRTDRLNLAVILILWVCFYLFYFTHFGG